MTKKFWNDWKERVDETYRIELFKSIKIDDHFYNKWTLLNHTFADDEIIKATFNNDSVDLVIKKHEMVPDESFAIRAIDFNVTLERSNIKSIEFNRKL